MKVFKLRKKLLQKLKLLLESDVLLSFFAEFFDGIAAASFGRDVLIKGMT